jgi:FdhD protein
MTRPAFSRIRREIPKFRGGEWRQDADDLSVEEPLEMRVAWDDGESRGKQPITITMRTPGHDFELTAGFLFGEGIVAERKDIEDIGYCREVESEDERCNTILVTLRQGLGLNIKRQERNFNTTSACGVCGKASLSALAITGCARLPTGTPVSADLICRLPGLLGGAQPDFRRTGGSHATGLFTGDGQLLGLQEDVGRHNAFDKLVGEQFLRDGPRGLAGNIVVLSGRASFELLQKALMARIPVVVALGAPSSLAVQIAEAFNITLAGFARESGFNVYAGRERISG